MLSFEEWREKHVKSDSEENLKQLPSWMIEEAERIIRQEYDEYVKTYQEV